MFHSGKPLLLGTASSILRWIKCRHREDTGAVWDTQLAPGLVGLDPVAYLHYPCHVHMLLEISGLSLQKCKLLVLIDKEDF